jgi:hypothetical protein
MRYPPICYKMCYNVLCYDTLLGYGIKRKDLGDLIFFERDVALAYFALIFFDFFLSKNVPLKKIMEYSLPEAQGKADANRILSASLTDKILQDKGIDATLELAKSPNSKVVIVGSGMCVEWIINVKNFVLLYGFPSKLFLQNSLYLNSPLYELICEFFGDHQEVSYANNLT